jgi:hypothetical protein
MWPLLKHGIGSWEGVHTTLFSLVVFKQGCADQTSKFVHNQLLKYQAKCGLTKAKTHTFLLLKPLACESILELAY